MLKALTVWVVLFVITTGLYCLQSLTPTLSKITRKEYRMLMKLVASKLLWMSLKERNKKKQRVEVGMRVGR